MTDKRRFWIFLLVAFGGGWLLEGLGLLLGGQMYQVCVAGAMLMPLLGVLLAHGGLKKAKTGIGWEPHVKTHAAAYLLAWFGPAVLTIVCAALFFALFPSRFDAGMSAVTAQYEALGVELPFPPAVLAVVQLVQAVTYAPFLNGVLAVGEEAGWRGYMTPYLTRRIGRTKGLLLADAIWGAWHWPLILLAGYEYGTGYPGAPFTGMLMMCVFTASLGILFTRLYERTDCIWAPALAHGALNAAAGLGLLFLAPGETSYLPGPTPAGLIAGIPLFALAAWALLSRPKSLSQEVSE